MHHSNNALKTAALLGLLSAILIIGGRAIAGDRGIEYGLIIAVVMNFASYYFSDKIALATSGAQPLTQETAPDIYARVAPLVGRLAQRMNIPMPKLYITPEPSPNAFATGRNPNNASVAFTQGILQLMDDSELEGVVAHELGHVLNRDILISSIAGTIAAAITVLSRFALFFGGGNSRDPDYRLGPNDRVRIIVFGQPTLTGEYTLDGNGVLAFPLIGNVNASGQTPSQLQQAIDVLNELGLEGVPVVGVAKGEARRAAQALRRARRPVEGRRRGTHAGQRDQ